MPNASKAFSVANAKNHCVVQGILQQVIRDAFSAWVDLVDDTPNTHGYPERVGNASVGNSAEHAEAAG